MEIEGYVKKETLTGKMRENPWILSTLVLGILALVLIVGSFGITGNISKNEVGDKILKFAENQVTGEVKLVSADDFGSGLYTVTLDINGNEVPVQVTKDGKYMISSLIPLQASASETPTSAGIPKSDKPVVELYVFTYCPYGLQMEKATIPVVKLLGNAIDFKIRQIGAMHGDYEKVEAERQLCIEKNYPDKFLDYSTEFASDTNIGNCNGDDKCVTPLINSIYIKLGIDGKKINSCMTSEGESLYDAEVQNSQAKGVSGSPTLLINGVVASASRSPAGVLDAVCQAFNTAPEICGTGLSTASSSAGFGSGTSDSNSAVQCAT